MSINDGQPVDAANSNPAWISKNTDDTATGAYNLANTLTPASGPTVSNVQREINSLDSFTGRAAGTAYNAVPTYITDQGFTPNGTLLLRANEISQSFDKNTGHSHDGSDGGGQPIGSASLTGVPLRGYIIQGVTFSGASGSSIDISSDMTGKVPSAGSGAQGVVVTAPQNKIVLRQGSGASEDDAFFDGSGNLVYGRLTESSGVWTISFFVMLSGTETVYSFASPVDLKYYYQELFNPIVNAPVYSEYSITPSDNTTADIIDATESAAGKVLLSNIVAQSVGSSNVKGTGPRVSHEDHVHQGVHAVFTDDLVNIYGDVKYSAGTGMTISRVGQILTFQNSYGAVGYQEVPAGPVNGVNTSFGPLAFLPSSIESVIVFVDGLPVDKSKWTLSTQTIVFGSGNQPVTGQDIYVFYISQGIPATPPTPTGTIHTEYRTITSGEQSAKIIVLANTPSVPNDVLVDIISGSAQEFNVDYTVVGNEFRWNGYALDGILAAGDKIRFHYLT